IPVVCFAIFATNQFHRFITATHEYNGDQRRYQYTAFGFTYETTWSLLPTYSVYWASKVVGCRELRGYTRKGSGRGGGKKKNHSHKKVVALADAVKKLVVV
ncbi:hypothetical protein MKW98_003106, partial [Papaver atlanticum]